MKTLIGLNTNIKSLKNLSPQIQSAFNIWLLRQPAEQQKFIIETNYLSTLPKKKKYLKRKIIKNFINSVNTGTFLFKTSH